METTVPVYVGVSSCLLGEKVRYDGGHKLDHYIHDTLGAFFQWVPVCPEVECGLSIPREAMHLVDKKGDIRLVTVKTDRDYTDQMKVWSKKRIDEFEKTGLSGFIFKSRSPSSGMSAVKVYPENSDIPQKNGTGIFAQAFMERFPLLPVEDEGRLHDPKLRENFIERVFVFSRWLHLITNNPTASGLVDFHTDHKYLIMAHSPLELNELGKLVADVHDRTINIVTVKYIQILMGALKRIATVKKNVNVLGHIMGYFKKNLSKDEKSEMADIIESYHKEFTPLTVPITLLNHYIRKYDEHYLKRQLYLNPHPRELMLRNHV